MEEVSLTSVYFSEIPDRVKAEEVYELFSCIGKVVEVVIFQGGINLGRDSGYLDSGR